MRTNRGMLFSAVLCLVTAFAMLPRAVNAGVFNPETFTLSNGMEVVVVSNHRIPVVTHMVWYRVGSADEMPNESGIAHFLEHLMFKGTNTRAPGEFSDIVSRVGGRENAFTSTDYTGYYQTVAVEHLETVMELEADRMTNLVITDAEVEPERQVVLEERRSRVDNDPASILGEHINATLFLSHPYRNPVIGWQHDIEALDIRRILDFYKRWYAPNNAILVVAGDITAAQLKPLAEKHYGTIPAQPPTVRARAAEPPQKAARSVTMKDARVRQPFWRRVFIAPGLNWGDKRHSYPLEVLSDILGGGASSRLYRTLVIEKKLAVSAGTYYSGDNRGPGRFGVYASPRPGVDVETLAQAVEAELHKVVAEGVSEDEVRRAKDRMQAAAIYARDSLSRGARVLGAALASGLSVEEVEAWPERIEAVSTAGIKDAAIEVLNNSRSVTATLLPGGRT